jgi:hypothetical protein
LTPNRLTSAPRETAATSNLTNWSVLLGFETVNVSSPTLAWIGKRENLTS